MQARAELVPLLQSVSGCLGAEGDVDLEEATTVRNMYIREGAAAAHSHRAGGFRTSIENCGSTEMKSPALPRSAYSMNQTRAPSAGRSASAGSGPHSPPVGKSHGFRILGFGLDIGVDIEPEAEDPHQTTSGARPIGS